MRQGVAACLAFVLLWIASAGAATAAPVRVSGASPFPHGCAGESDPYKPGYEGDASVAVDPSDPRHVAAVWTADVSYVLGRATMLAVSHDGGRSFGAARVVPGFTACSGGPSNYHNSYNPHVAIGPRHWLYVTAITTAGGLAATPVATAASPDDGKSFGPVTRFDMTVAILADAPIVFADHRHPGHVGLAWIRLPSAALVAGQYESSIALSETKDGGRTWTSPSDVATRPVNTVDSPTSGVFERDGSVRLLTVGAVFNNGQAKRQRAGEIDLQSNLATVKRDAQYVDAPEEKVTDPDHPDVLAEYRPDPAWAPGGRLVVWMVHEGGRWVVRQRQVDASGAAPARPITTSKVPLLHLQPAVAGDGRLLLGSYDWRGHTARAPKLATAFHVLSSRDGGAHWSEQRLTKPFDLRSAKDAYGLELFLTHTGQGAELRHGALEAIVAGRPVAQYGKTDVFVGRVAPGPGG